MIVTNRFIPRARPGEAAARARSEAAPDTEIGESGIVSTTDPQGRITSVSDGFCALSKFSRDELLGQDYRIFNSGHHSRDFFDQLWATILDGRVWHGEIQIRGRDGGSFWVAATIVPLLDERGKISQYMAVCEDLGEAKRVEAQLAESLRMQRLLGELSSRFVALPSDEVDAAIEATQRLIAETLGLDRCSLWQLESDDSKMVCTHSWRRPGYPSVQLLFSTAEHLPWVHARIMRGEVVCFSRVDDLPPEAARDAEVFRRHGPKSKTTIPLIASGKVFGALAFATLGEERNWRADELAELKLVAQIVGNVVGRQRAELREQELRTELSHTMRIATLGELVAALAHELNQPLSAILSNAQAARRFIASGEMPPEELRAILDDIVRDNKRAGGVIHNLRAMVSKRPAVPETCQLNELVTEVLELMHAELIGERIAVRSALAPELPEVELARVELQQVLVNLLLNAVQAMKETPAEQRSIEVSTKVESGQLVISIRDRGHGISPDRLATVFDPFVSTKQNGLGMGLSVSRRIIENHGGRIAALNHAEGGAVFTFTLPAHIAGVTVK